MRISFFDVIEGAVKSRDDIFVLTGDLGFRLFDKISAARPERFFNMGVAEANMIGVSAGLALSGKRVYCYSIIPFLVMRAYEQIRIDVAHHNLDVRLIGVGGGFAYGLEGITHFGLEDMALMRALPNMTVVAPADPAEADCLAKASVDHKGPIYIRLGKTGDPPVHQSCPDFEIGKGIVLREGRGLALVAIGSMVHTALEAAALLEAKGITPTVVDIHTLKPLDVGLVKQVASAHEAVMTIEEHSINGGLGSAVAEVLAEGGNGCAFRRAGIRDVSNNPVGGSAYLRDFHGLTAGKICGVAMDLLGRG